MKLFNASDKTEVVERERSKTVRDVTEEVLRRFGRKDFFVAIYERDDKFYVRYDDAQLTSAEQTRLLSVLSDLDGVNK